MGQMHVKHGTSSTKLVKTTIRKARKALNQRARQIVRSLLYMAQKFESADEKSVKSKVRNKRKLKRSDVELRRR
jgi:hypothetical protein